MSAQLSGKTKAQVRIHRFLTWLLPVSLLNWLNACLSPAPTNYLTVELTAVERAKMAQDHRWKLGEIFLDKGCFTIFAGAVAGAILWGGNYFLEDYRSKEARERVLTEERLKALTGISAAHSKMTRTFFIYSNEEPNTPTEKATAEYKKAIDNFMHEVNRNLPLLGKEFDQDVNWYSVCHRKFRDIGVTKCDKYGELASNLENEFNGLCEAYLKKGKILSEDRMVLNPIPRAVRVTIKTPEEYIARQVEYRKNHGKEDAVPEETEHHP